MLRISKKYIAMPNIIHIETSTEVCSVALSCDGYVQFHRESFDGPSHASLLGDYVKDAVTYARLKELPLHAVAVSGGPRLLYGFAYRRF